MTRRKQRWLARAFFLLIGAAAVTGFVALAVFPTSKQYSSLWPIIHTRHTALVVYMAIIYATLGILFFIILIGSFTETDFWSNAWNRAWHDHS